MAVDIDHLQVQTQTPQPESSTSPANNTPSRPMNIKAEIEKLREREFRLRAD